MQPCRRHALAFLLAFLDDAEQPQDQNQDQNTAKTDIHDTLLCWFCCCNGERHLVVPVVTAPVETCLGMILPVRKAPDLLDFSRLARN